MGFYKVYYLNRDGHTERCEVHAKNEQEAREKVSRKHDDVFKVKPVDGGITGGQICIGVIVVALVVLFAMLLKANS